ncbi:uncharacterized protein LOC118235061 [Anguilla anguilla]|uniref:uncharacterized protein LOC118235061 n=1 Tax=Anguilla anguilla TaxID=7936 RepID=UPI0015ADDDEB|nr:uncharacterized protein LOC118235061 [Anguilla anguilla]
MTGEATLVDDVLDEDEFCDSGAVLHGKLKDSLTSHDAKHKVSSCDLMVTAVTIPTGTDTVDTEMASSCSPPLIDQITGEATLVADMLDVDEICDSGAVLHGKLKDAVTSCEAKNKVSSCDLQGAPDSALAEEKPDSEDERESSDDSREESRNSGSDSTIDTRTIVSKIRHQRNSDVPVLRRTKSLLLNERILAESDFSEYYDSSADSEENYIPDSCEESSNSDETYYY